VNLNTAMLGFASLAQPTESKTNNMIQENISKTNDDIPNWHKTILLERAELVKNGKAEYIDWESAKISIKKEIDDQKNLNNL